MITYGLGGLALITMGLGNNIERAQMQIFFPYPAPEIVFVNKPIDVAVISKTDRIPVKDTSPVIVVKDTSQFVRFR